MGEWHHPQHYTETARAFAEETRASEIGIFMQRCFPRMREAARGLGYALAVHGTQRRDLDLIAAPWIWKAADPEALVDRLCAVVKDCTGWGHQPKREKWTDKPQGRVALIIIASAEIHIDLSIMPRVGEPPKGEP